MNLKNKQHQTVDNGSSCSRGLGVGLTVRRKEIVYYETVRKASLSTHTN
jgi:hypothetical protein